MVSYIEVALLQVIFVKFVLNMVHDKHSIVAVFKIIYLMQLLNTPSQLPLEYWPHILGSCNYYFKINICIICSHFIWQLLVRENKDLIFFKWLFEINLHLLSSGQVIWVLSKGPYIGLAVAGCGT